MIDANPILKKELTGIGNYTYFFIKNLFLCKNKDQKIVFFYNSKLKPFFNQYLNELPAEALESIEMGFKYRFPPDLEIGRFTRRINDFFIWRDFKNIPVSIFHGTSFFLPSLPRKIKQVVTIYDVAFIRYLDLENSYFRKRLISLIGYSLKKAEKIIAISQTTKNDLVYFFNVDDKKIEVIYGGVDEDFAVEFSEDEKNRFILDNGLPDNFLLFVGSINIRKNLLTLIKAFANLKSNDLHLVVVGKNGNQYNDVMKTIENLSVENIHFLGYCPKSMLIKLYKTAVAYICPSLYEGFGLPVLEAMRLGCPCIVSNNSALEELFSDSAILIDPNDIDSICEGVNKIIQRNDLRKKYSELGLAKSQEFSWKNTAKQTLELYRESCF